MMGRAKASVFPVPVLALASEVSFSSKIVENVAAWMGNNTFTPRACKACLVTDDREKSGLYYLQGVARASFEALSWASTDLVRGRESVCRRRTNPRSWPFSSSFGAWSSSSLALRFSFFFFFFSGTGSPAAANLFFSALRAALRSALPWPSRCRCRRCPWLLFVVFRGALAGVALGRSCCFSVVSSEASPVVVAAGEAMPLGGQTEASDCAAVARFETTTK